MRVRVCVCVCELATKRYWPSFAAVKETGACCGFCLTPEQVNEQPSLVFRTTLLKADDPDVQRLEVTWNSAKHQSSLTGSTSSTSGSLSTSHGNPLTLTTANLADDAKPLRYDTLPYILFSSAVNWDTPPRSCKVKVKLFLWHRFSALPQ